jgi:hypothetical protein
MLQWSVWIRQQTGKPDVGEALGRDAPGGADCAKARVTGPPRGEWSGQAEWMRFARLIQRRDRVFWRTCGPRRLRRQSQPCLGCYKLWCRMSTASVGSPSPRISWVLEGGMRDGRLLQTSSVTAQACVDRTVVGLDRSRKRWREALGGCGSIPHDDRRGSGRFLLITERSDR